MLVLSRKTDERIIIGDSIRIQVVGVHGDKVRLGIDAPGDIAVHREEVFNAIQSGKGKRINQDGTTEESGMVAAATDGLS
ncbi:carbon storage regulator CsrA [Crateriforma conspicua]|uniref:Translational regulator CsrA n=1 Tax=Crateriforma conspicua TaxID=2527996 RepID=A0A5C5XS16_9PLAN|nr:carbon storage regulator CsrA [Crateriforma conspicua]TWT65650.1 Carbon storage regulator [Crateriforma conspicua]